MKKFFSVALVTMTTQLAFADVKFEYQAVEYSDKMSFMKIATDLGNKGWELTTCPTTGAAQYTGSISGQIHANMHALIARSQYCIFKRAQTTQP